MYLEFEKYLQSAGISTKSIKNYKSDISQFFAWSKSKLEAFGTYVESIHDAIPFLTHEFVSQFLRDMTESKLPRKTINRRLSTLRHLSRFLTTQAIIDSDFMDGIQNIAEVQKIEATASLTSHPSVSEFQAYLEAEKISKNTIKNYISDIRQFLNWLDLRHAKLT